jgi:hypothetical protein
MPEKTNAEFAADLDAAVQKHMLSIVGTPLQRLDILARAIMYLSVLFHAYNLSGPQLDAVIDLARRTQISTIKAAPGSEKGN